MDESRFLSVVSYICLSRLGSNAPPLIPLGALVCSRHSLRTPSTFHATISCPPCGRDGGEEVGRPEPWPEISPFVRPRVPLSNQFPQWRGSPSRLSAYENEEQRAPRRGEFARGWRGSREPAKRAPSLQTLHGGVSQGAAGYSQGSAVRKHGINSSELNIHLANTSIVALPL